MFRPPVLSLQTIGARGHQVSGEDHVRRHIGSKRTESRAALRHLRFATMASGVREAEVRIAIESAGHFVRKPTAEDLAGKDYFSFFFRLNSS